MKNDIKRTDGYKNTKDTQGKQSRGKRCNKLGTERKTGHKYNDVSWYTKNDQMLRDAASFSFNNPLGSINNFYDLTRNTKAGGTCSFAATKTVPGVCSMHIAMCPGKSLQPASPVNLAAQNIYSFVRYMNSGAKNYDEPDLMLYLLSMDSIYARWNWLKRLYGLARTYSQYNWYLPRILVSANGVNFDDLTANLADLRMALNRFAAQISAFCVPGVMPIFVRHSWMFSNVYKDSDTLKAQCYEFVPSYFFRYNELDGAGRLDPIANFNANLTASKTVADLISDMEADLNALFKSEDIGIMSGDILKAYGQEKLFKLTPVDPDYSVVPVYNEEVLNQIHNACSVGSPIRDNSTYLSTWAITQDPGTNNLIWNPTLNSSVIAIDGAMLNMPWDNVTPANVMVGTRLTATTDYSPTSPYNGTIKTCGTEVWNEGFFYHLDPTASDPTQWQKTEASDKLILATPGADDPWSVTASAVFNLISRMTLASQFDWFPLQKVFLARKTNTAVGEVMAYAGIHGDMNNYTIITDDGLDKLNLTAVMSEFNIPQIGSF